MSPDAYVEMDLTEENHWWFAGRRTIVRSLLQRMRLPPTADILEVGCGTGGNLALLSEFGQAYAFDMNESACDLARHKRATAKIQQGVCPHHIPFSHQLFDLVCLFDVLEHIKEDIETLNNLRGKLKIGGRILLTVPAIPALWSKHDEFLHHQRRYTKVSLQQAVQEAGFEVEFLSYFNAYLLPLAAISRVINRFSDKPIGTKLPSPWINTILRIIFSAERHWLMPRRFPLGVSLLLLATPQLT
jgi:SAM-dependent methyltransferase